MPLAMVARTVGRAEVAKQPKAQAALQKEWDKLRDISGTGESAWDEVQVEEWSDVKAKCKDWGELHIGSLHELCVEKRQ